MGFMEKGKIRVKGLLEGEGMLAPAVTGAAVAVAGGEGMEAPASQETEA